MKYSNIEDVKLTSIEQFYEECKNIKPTVCGGGESVEWTYGDVLCISCVRKEGNSVSSTDGNCMYMKKRVKCNGRFMNK